MILTGTLIKVEGNGGWHVNPFIFSEGNHQLASTVMSPGRLLQFFIDPATMGLVFDSTTAVQNAAKSADYKKSAQLHAAAVARNVAKEVVVFEEEYLHPAGEDAKTTSLTSVIDSLAANYPADFMKYKSPAQGRGRDNEGFLAMLKKNNVPFSTTNHGGKVMFKNLKRKKPDP